ncbi:MAG: ABC transporter ATP-binding protein [Gordonia sp. (in: high G+C Gram-positive bacteria)]|uniref:ABC transporter ATP-binding protein n=1 Tax=Gordonia sp. (in: high G+C Gram-positive bacteria) TaxID=84139 RepID=UPI0039E7201D
MKSDAETSSSGGYALLWSFARPYRRLIALGTLLGLVSTAIALATPMATKYVLDGLGSGAGLAVPITILVVLLILGIGAGFTQTILLGRLAQTIVLNARKSLIHRFFHARLEQIQRYRTGELVTRVTSDTVLLREATTSSIVELINGTVAIVGAVVLMAMLDWPLLLTTLAAIVVMIALFVVLVPKIGEADKAAQESLGDLGATLESGVRAMRTVKADSAEDRETELIGAAAERSARHSMRSVWYTALIWAVSGGGIQLAIIAILGIGAWRVELGAMVMSTLVAFLLYAFNIVAPITSIAASAASLQSGLAAAARIRDTENLQQEDIAARPADARPAAADPDAPAVALREVTARYLDSETPALSGVTVEIPRTGHLALVGPSGSGKTTVLSLILRLVDPDGGHLELDGVPYDDLSIGDVRARMSYVEQETPIIPGTVRENILFRAGEQIPDDEVWSALEVVRLADKIRALPDGLDTHVDDTTLSGGERQRIAVARALVRPPDILLLDEATAQLDGSTEAAIHEVIAEAARTGAVVTVAHRLSTVLDADRIVLLDGGRVRDQGTHRELLDRDDLYREFITALRIGST